MQGLGRVHLFYDILEQRPDTEKQNYHKTDTGGILYTVHCKMDTKPVFIIRKSNKKSGNLVKFRGILRYILRNFV